MKQKRTPPIGHCIYCDAVETIGSELSEEHTIPRALNGSVILTKASCKECAAVTGKIEQSILRGMLWEIRTHLKMKTRHPDERPTHFPVYGKNGWHVERHDLPIDENPFVLCLPILASPSILLQSTERYRYGMVDPFKWSFTGWHNEAQYRTALAYDKATSFDLGTFYLFLAKIAYCCAVAMKGYRSFESPIPSLIKTRSEDVGYYVGGCANPLEKNRNGLHHVNVIAATDYIVVQFSLFANLGAPYYEVVVGTPKAI